MWTALAAAVLTAGSAAVPGTATRRLVEDAGEAECFNWTAQDADGPSLTVYGDSVSRGNGRPSLGIHGETSWYSHLYCPGQITGAGNEAVGGQTAEQIGARLAADAPEADWIVLQAGTNDLRLGLPVDVTVAALDQALQVATGTGARVAVATAPPWPGTDARDLNARIGDLADRHGATLLDFAGVLRADGATRDHVHPTVDGAKKLAALVRDAIS
jgi:acyl-CoA thioesterase I